MALDFTEETFVDTLALQQGESNKPQGIPQSKNLTGIELRLSKAFVIDNKTFRVPPFPGYAKIYLIVLVVTDTGDVIQTLDLKSFAKVDDHEDIPVDKTIYYWKQNEKTDKAPSQLHALISIVKSKDKLRNVANVLSNVKNDTTYSTVVDRIKSVVKTGTEFTNVTNLLFEVAGIIGKFLGNVDDKTLMTWVQSYSDINGDWDQLGKTVKSKKNRYAEIDLSLTIRDAEREKLLTGTGATEKDLSDEQ